MGATVPMPPSRNPIATWECDYCWRLNPVNSLQCGGCSASRRTVTVSSVRADGETAYTWRENVRVGGPISYPGRKNVAIGYTAVVSERKNVAGYMENGT